jgi:hypothetical protein
MSMTSGSSGWDPPAPPAAPGGPPAPAKKSWFANQWVRYAIVFVIGLVVGGAALGGAAADTDGDPVAAPTTAINNESPADAPTTTETVPPDEPEPEPTFTNILRSDVSLDLKTKSRQCFGSAGCLVEVEVELSLDMTNAEVENLPRGATWDVTYRITGDESGPIIGTFSIYGNGKYDVNSEIVSTPSTNTPVNIKLMSVERY